MLDGKICLVTGAAQGIGRATAVEMARQGAATVVVSDINDAGGEETAELVRSAGGAAHYRHCDMTDGSQIKSLIEDAVAQAAGSTCSTTTPGCTSPT